MLNNVSQNQNIYKQCCTFQKLIEDQYIVCVNCGQTFDNIINTDSEVMNYKNEQTIISKKSNQRCSKTQDNFQEYSLGTIFDSHTVHKNVSVLNQRQKVILELMRYYNQFEKYGANENIINNAVDTFLKLSGHDSYQKKSRHIFKGTRRVAMIAICLDYAFQKFDCERLVSDICKVFGFSTRVYFKEVERFNFICKTISLPLYEIRCDTDQIIFNYINHLNLPRKILKLTIILYKSTVKLKLFKNISIKPKSMICGLLYCIMIELNQFEIAEKIPIKLQITKNTLEKFKKTFQLHKQSIYCIANDMV